MSIFHSLFFLMPFLLQIDLIDTADKINPVAGFFVWGLFSLVGYTIAYLVWLEYRRQKKEISDMIAKERDIVIRTTETLTQMSGLLNQIENRTASSDAQHLAAIQQLNQNVSNMTSTMQAFIQIQKSS